MLVSRRTSRLRGKGGELDKLVAFMGLGFWSVEMNRHSSVSVADSWFWDTPLILQSMRGRVSVVK